MSADNMVVVVHFKKTDGTTTYRVGEVRLSGMEHEMLELMEKGPYTEHASENQAAGAALILERKLFICEYGVSSYGNEDIGHGPFDLEHFRAEVEKISRY